MKTKSPIKHSPLRNPGESLDKEIDNVIYDELMANFVVALFSILWTMLEWHRWYYKLPPSPWIWTFFSVLVTAYAAVKIFRGIKKIKGLKQGRDGEKAVGQYLEHLRESGAQVFHDVPGDGFNLDHVVIHNNGIFVIETKTFSKPEKGEAKITFNGEAIYLHGIIENNKPIVQVKAAANWLAGQLNESTGQKFNVKPVVVFLGWFIEPLADAKTGEVWALNPKALPTFISNSKVQLEDNEVKLAAFHLSRYIRATLKLEPSR